jgi:autotransporter translocation and assembly factor TamB
VDSVEVTYINQPAGILSPAILTTPPSWPLSFDIAINAPEISVTGQELDSLWKGKLTVTGNTAMPLLFGSFKVVEGYYMFNGKNFSIDQGTVIFGGEIEKKTNLYVIAARDLGKVKVEVIMKGPLKNPEISFRSNPPLSQREILSWILFNRGTSEISHFQGSQLRESITNLSGTHKSPDVLTKIRNALGIDRIDFCKGGQGDSNAMGFQVGKYISQNVFVSINKSDVNRLAVEAALMEYIKLQAEIGDDAEGNLMLKWKRDY